MLFGSALLIVLLIIYAFYIEPRFIHVRREKVFIKDLNSSLDGFTILHLSDIHLKGKEPYKIKAIKKMATASFDIAVITGDMIDANEGIPYCIDALAVLSDKRPVFAVFGNHDHYRYKFISPIQTHLLGKSCATGRKNNVEELKELLKKQGVFLLQDAHVLFEHNGSKICIIGIDDYCTGKGDLKIAAKGMRHNDFRILLTHSPDILLDQYCTKIELNMAFTGHSHGGQVRIPFFGAFVTHSKLPAKMSRGLFEFNGFVVHASPGIGAFRFCSLRFLSPPEITLLELHSA